MNNAEFDHFGRIVEILEQSHDMGANPKIVRTHLKAALGGRNVSRVHETVLNVYGQTLFPLPEDTASDAGQ